ncbi:hypothetical protein N8203_04365, partial [Crocinitomicaceae bacterium]|nr:hypothetical protein [Crocinitomicaceae bacterium]
MFDFLIDLAVILTLFSLIYDYVFALPITFVITLIGVSEIWTTRIIKGSGAIVMASLCSNVILGHSNQNFLLLIIYSLIGGVLLLLSLAAGSGD